MITVYGRATSLNVQAVTWTLAELALAYERLDYSFGYGGTDTPAYRAMNPNGLVPTPRRDRSALAGYYARLCERPACAQHVMVPYDILRQMRR